MKQLNGVQLASSVFTILAIPILLSKMWSLILGMSFLHTLGIFIGMVVSYIFCTKLFIIIADL